MPIWQCALAKARSIVDAAFVKFSANERRGREEPHVVFFTFYVLCEFVKQCAVGCMYT